MNDIADGEGRGARRTMSDDEMKPKANPQSSNAFPSAPPAFFRSLAIAVIFWVALIPAIAFPGPRLCGNVWSRYMTVESLAERLTLAVDDCQFKLITPDRVWANRHLYSDKPPVLPFLAAFVYGVGGLSFKPDNGAYAVANFVLTWVCVGSMSGLALFALRRLLTVAPIRPWIADLLTLGFGFSSLLWSYGVTFNNHSVGAGLITAAFALVALEPAKRRNRNRFWAGLLAGFAATIDLPPGCLTLAALGVWLTLRDRWIPWWYLGGAFGPLALHSALQWPITGSPLPVEMNPKLLEFPGSYWATEEGRWKEVGPRWRFGVEYLFGPQGWVTMTPVLLLGIAGMIRSALRPSDPVRTWALAMSGITTILISFYIWGVRRCDYAGMSYGSRHLLPLAPILFFFAVYAIARLPRGWKSLVGWLVFASMMAIGGVYAYAGMLEPWSRVDRPLPKESPLYSLRYGKGEAHGLPNRGDEFPLKLVKPLTLYPYSTYPR